jgi:hypothetical protein
MRENQNGYYNPPRRENGLRDDREYGHSDPSASKRLVLAAVDLYCSICDATPCYLLRTAAVTVAQEQLTEADGQNLIGALRYEESLEKLHHCLIRHHEVTRKAWQLDNHFRVSEEALCELERQRIGMQANLQMETRNGDP